MKLLSQRVWDEWLEECRQARQWYEQRWMEMREKERRLVPSAERPDEDCTST